MSANVAAAAAAAMAMANQGAGVRMEVDMAMGVETAEADTREVVALVGLAVAMEVGVAAGWMGVASEAGVERVRGIYASACTVAPRATGEGEATVAAAGAAGRERAVVDGWDWVGWTATRAAANTHRIAYTVAGAACRHWLRR